MCLYAVSGLSPAINVGVGVAGDRPRAQSDAAKRRPEIWLVTWLVERHLCSIAEWARLAPLDACDVELELMRPQVRCEIQVIKC